MQKNDEIELEIEDLGIHGEGIGHAMGMAVFVPGAIPGDRIRAGITKKKKNYAYARLISVEEPSEDRVVPVCPIARQCGGCQLQEMDYAAQLRWKEKHVQNLLIRVGGFPESQIREISEPIIGMEDPWRFRNKAQYPIGKDKQGRPIAGFYAPHSHRIVPCTDCRIGALENQKILKAILSWMQKNRVQPYDETTGQGLLRHVLIRQAIHTKETMVCLVTNGNRIPAAESLLEALRMASPDLTSLTLNINRDRTNVILGRETKTLWGEDTITDMIGDIAFRISPRSFFQVNPLQMEKLYGKALEYAGLTGEENVYDLYCGIGSISLFLARNAGHVTGIEIIPEAIQDAKENARRNGISNADFYAGATEDVLPRLIEKGKSDFGKLSAQEQALGSVYISGRPADVIVLDPPRKGCEPSVLLTILAAAPERIVYVSCDPATLARDLKILCADGAYELKKVCPVDQFGHSVHVETIVLLTRTNS